MRPGQAMLPSTPHPIIHDAVFAELTGLIHHFFGIVIEPHRKSFVISRLQPLLLQSGCADFGEFLALLRADASNLWLSEMANRITTHHTSFFREAPHFDFLLREALPDIERRKRREVNNDIRIWCAASATGEEPYTIAMCLLRYFGSRYSEWLAGVLGTDISNAALARARIGIYPPAVLRHLTADQRLWFRKLSSGDFQVADVVRREVIFRRFNMICAAYPFRKPFDIIFCRNVMIYFDEPTREALTAKLHQWLQPGGYLFVGHAEAINPDAAPFRYICPAVYQKEP